MDSLKKNQENHPDPAEMHIPDASSPYTANQIIAFIARSPNIGAGVKELLKEREVAVKKHEHKKYDKLEVKWEKSEKECAEMKEEIVRLKAGSKESAEEIARLKAGSKESAEEIVRLKARSDDDEAYKTTLLLAVETINSNDTSCQASKVHEMITSKVGFMKVLSKSCGRDFRYALPSNAPGADEYNCLRSEIWGFLDGGFLKGLVRLPNIANEALFIELFKAATSALRPDTGDGRSVVMPQSEGASMTDRSSNQKPNQQVRDNAESVSGSNPSAGTSTDQDTQEEDGASAKSGSADTSSISESSGSAKSDTESVSATTSSGSSNGESLSRNASTASEASDENPTQQGEVNTSPSSANTPATSESPTSGDASTEVETSGQQSAKTTGIKRKRGVEKSDRELRSKQSKVGDKPASNADNKPAAKADKKPASKVDGDGDRDMHSPEECDSQFLDD